MTTKQAFKKLLKVLENKETPETMKLVGLSPVDIRQLRYRFKTSKPSPVTADTMEKLLKRYGAKKTPEHWDFPENK